MQTADQFFTEEQKQQIVEATRQAESRSAGEIVVLVADGGRRYYDIEAVSAVGVSAVISLVVVATVFHFSFWHWLVLSTLVFPFSFLFFARAQTITLGLVPHWRREKAVRDGALRAFYEHGLHKTKRQTGVLFYISLIERRVNVLADKGIHDKITQQVLERHASDVAAGIKAGRACEAVVHAITEIGEVLAAHFPRSPDEVNELPDLVLSDSDQ